jgi:hypothetical protein
MRLSFLKTKMTEVSGKLVLGMLLAATVATGCKKDDENGGGDDGTPGDLVVKEVTGTLTGDITWSADTVYLLKGFVRVGSDNGTTISATGKLTIEPGTLILGDRETKGTLIIQRGSQIFAVGEENKPIVFTSERGIGLKSPGDWGGVVICGRAFNNVTAVTGNAAQLEGNYGAFHGGDNNDDNSGEMKYVRIEYAGIAINPNEEVNSLTMGSVGSATKISYIQCSYGLDDAFEWFGGTVNCSNLIAMRNLDDDWDVDQGYSGRVQFALSIKDPIGADQSGSNGFEVDGPDAAFTNGAETTSGKFANMTVIGPKQTRETAIATQYQHAIQIRRSAKISIYNSFFTGFPRGIALESANTQNFANSDVLQLRGNVLAAVENWGGSGFGASGKLYVNNTVGYLIVSPPGEPVVRDSTTGAAHPNDPRGNAFLSSPSYTTEAFWLANNTFLPKWQDAGISPSLFDLGTPSVLPLGGSILLSDAVALPSGFQQVSYRGAFGSTDWTLNWTEWNPNVKNYLEK